MPPAVPPARSAPLERLAALVALAVLVAALTTGSAAAQAVTAAPVDTPVGPIARSYLGTLPLEELARGGIGRGWLLFHTPDLGPTRPRLVVALERINLSPTATALVYDAPPGRDTVPIEIVDGEGGPEVLLLAEREPALRLVAEGGSWLTPNGRGDYNLSVEVRGPVFSSWLGERWIERVEGQTEIVDIRTADRERDGVPDWDLRLVIPPFRGNGFIRSNYVERECLSPLAFDPGVEPLWPFIATRGTHGYEQPYGENTFVPPIRIDWQAGRVTAFGEVVTARNQSCSYSFYSIPRLDPDEVNEPNFESPFAFYDLSGEPNGFPNLIIRTDRFPAGDPWSQGFDPEAEDREALLQPIERIRYSWRNAPGDGFWDYKVEVLGFHAYDFETPIADGAYTVDLPPYDTFPEWILQRPWPVTVFIDTEGRSYRSSEGIYDWSPLDVGIGYLLGREENPRATAFGEAPRGFRGEYRYQQALEPELYVSPIDGRFHLVGAERGTWDLGFGDRIVEARNLDGDRTLDLWHAQGASGEEHFVDLGGLLLASDASGTTIRAVDVPDETLVVRPPSDEASWAAFRDLTEQLAPQRADPTSLVSWIDRFDGPTARLDGIRVDSVEAWRGVVSLVVEVAPGAVVSGDLEVGPLTTLAPGSYVLRYDRAATDGAVWSAAPASPAAIEVGLDAGELTALEPGLARVRLSNTGSLEWQGDVYVYAGGFDIASFEGVRIPGGEVLDEDVAFVPWEAGDLPVEIEVGELIVERTVQVGPAVRVAGERALELSIVTNDRYALALLLIPLIACAVALFAIWRTS